MRQFYLKLFAQRISDDADGALGGLYLILSYLPLDLIQNLITQQVTPCTSGDAVQAVTKKAQKTATGPLQRRSKLSDDPRRVYVEDSHAKAIIVMKFFIE